MIGRGVPLEPNEAPEIKLIYLRDITPESEGNALGIGMADFMHERCFRKVDLKKTYINTQAALNPPMGFLPMHFPSDALLTDGPSSGAYLSAQSTITPSFDAEDNLVSGWEAEQAP